MTKPVKRKDGGFEEKTKKIKPKRQAAKSIREKVESLVGANLKDAKRKDGQPSQGQMKRKDGSTFGLMGDDLLKKQARRDKIEGGLKTAGVGALLLGADKAGDYKDKKQADKKAAKEKESKKLTPFEKAFKAAADSGKKTFTFEGKKYNTDRTTKDPKTVRRAVDKKARGGMAVKSSSSRKSAPRGVGAALRGYGKEMR